MGQILNERRLYRARPKEHLVGGDIVCGACAMRGDVGVEQPPEYPIPPGATCAVCGIYDRGVEGVPPDELRSAVLKALVAHRRDDKPAKHECWCFALVKAAGFTEQDVLEASEKTPRG